VFALQDEIAGAIAAQLRPSAAPGSPSRTANQDAYDLYLRGTYFRNRLTRDAIDKAIAYYDQAIALDSGYAPAYAGKASAMGPLFYFGLAPREPGLTDMRAAAQRALALDEGLGEAHVALGIIHFFYEWNWPAAEREFRRATQLNPGDPHAFHMRANWFRAMGRVDEAIAMRRRALDLDPLNGRTAITLARDYIAAGRFDLAPEQYQRGIDIDSLNPLVLGLGPGLPSGMGELYERQGRADSAVAEYIRVAVRRGAPAEETTALREAFAADGMRGFWRRWLVYEERTSPAAPRALLMGAILARIGDADRAIEWLERAYRDKDPGLVYLGTNPDWEALRGDPRFIALMERMRLPR
jgi:serine/threonine-protein kinase